MKTAFASLLSALALLIALGFSMPAVAQAGCKNSGDQIRKISKGNARDAIGCLFNKKRSAQNVRRHGALERAAQDHSGVMASQRSICHQCAGEPALPQRASRTGYMSGSSNYKLGEIILGGSAKNSARDIVRAWMNSSGHRAVLMDGSYKHVGVGLSIRNGYVYATGDFGSN